MISIHALLAESDEIVLPSFERMDISIHALLAESDAPRRKHTGPARNFYPRSPCGERPTYTGQSTEELEFLSTLSLRRATAWASGVTAGFRHFYPRSPCGERLIELKSTAAGNLISIHALLAESDRLMLCPLHHQQISIHALLAESDGGIVWHNHKRGTISIHALLAESDALRGSVKVLCCDFYPRSPCGERPSEQVFVGLDSNFYPRSPCGERHEVVFVICRAEKISIHALLAESDLFWQRLRLLDRHFYPRSPCGERHYALSILRPMQYFYPRSPCGERHPTTTSRTAPP